MKNAKIKVLALAASLVVSGLLGCDDRVTGNNQKSESGATQAGVTKIKKNSKGLTSEQQNIDDRIKVTSDVSKVMWIHLISLDGKIIRRMPVRNKVTSSGKRLEPTTAIAFASSGNGTWGMYPEHNGMKTPEIIQPDGTYGSSDPYIFWFDPMGRYHQYGTAGGIGYLVTDYPIDLENPIDAITGLYNVNLKAAEWQKQIESKMVK